MRQKGLMGVSGGERGRRSTIGRTDGRSVGASEGRGGLPQSVLFSVSASLGLREEGGTGCGGRRRHYAAGGP